jgi:formiminoglutamase
MNHPKYYSPGSGEAWRGRIDDEEDPEAFRWHQAVIPIDLGRDSPPLPATGSSRFCLLGFPSDAGVERNLGRSGCGAGPAAIRGALAGLPNNFHPSAAIFDGGDVLCPDGDLEAALAVLGDVVARILGLGLFPILLGGGHEIALGHYMGLSRFVADPPPAIVNFDAHLDLRPSRGGITSGTMFRQIAENNAENNQPFSYFCVGAQKTANTRSLFRTAEELGAGFLLAAEIDQMGFSDAARRLDRFISGQKSVYLTVCTDVFSSAFAPGVSAPQPFGIHPEIGLRLIKHVLASGKVVGFDIAEVSPRFDNDSQTAKLAAVIIYALVNTLLSGVEGDRDPAAG